MRVCEGFWECISPDAWITSIGTLLGAFLGALIAGLITIKTIKHQLESDKEATRTSNLKNYVEVFTEISWTLDLITTNLKQLKNEMMKDNPDESKINKLLKQYTDLNRGYEYLNQINFVRLNVNISVRINLLKNLLLSIKSLNYSFGEDGRVNKKTIEEFEFLYEKLIENFKILKEKDSHAINELKEKEINTL